jgi:hypothetical protein
MPSFSLVTCSDFGTKVASEYTGTLSDGQLHRCRSQAGADARWIAAAGSVISPALLIADLGRPERFLAMLRAKGLRRQGTEASRRDPLLEVVCCQRNQVHGGIGPSRSDLEGRHL